MLRSRVSQLPRRRQTRVLALLLFGSVLVYLFLSRCVFLMCEIEGDSMQPTLKDGERLLVHRWLYAVQEPQRGDVVALQPPDDASLSVKRIIALPGETVGFDGGRIFVDGRQLHEPYISRHLQSRGGALSNNTYQVAAGCYFVLGDNRAVSVDSRHYGAVPRRSLVGPIPSVE